MYEEVEHTADWAIKARGRDLESLFASAAAGMMELAGVSLDQGTGAERRIELQAIDRETLLVDWLHELLVALELEGVAFREPELEITGQWRLEASVRAVPVVKMEKPIKAVTYNELQIREFSDGLEATIVFDV